MENGDISLDLESVSIVNDDRVLRSSRSFQIAPDAIGYQLNMSTRVNPTLQRHLSAHLSRVAAGTTGTIVADPDLQALNLRRW